MWSDFKTKHKQNTFMQENGNIQEEFCFFQIKKKSQQLHFHKKIGINVFRIQREKEVGRKRCFDGLFSLNSSFDKEGNETGLDVHTRSNNKNAQWSVWK